MVLIMDLVVVVSNADMATMSGRCTEYGVDKSLWRYICAQVDDLEARSFQHHSHQIFADVMQVAGNRADDDSADLFHPGFGQERFEDRGGCAHCPGGDEHFGDEFFADFEQTADFGHGRDACLVEDDLGGYAGIERSLDLGSCVRGIARQHGLIDCLKTHGLGSPLG